MIWQHTTFRDEDDDDDDDDDIFILCTIYAKVYLDDTSLEVYDIVCISHLSRRASRPAYAIALVLSVISCSLHFSLVNKLNPQTR